MNTSTAFHDARVAFTLGEDYAFYGLRLHDTADDAMRQGYDSGNLRFFHRRQPSDRFIRKWLQIRAGAWNRNRRFDTDITPEYLRTIDAPVCPVSGVVLTYATGADTDWSVDRLNNDGAYARGNLVVISSRVNAAKGNRSWPEILAIATSAQEVFGLSATEWQNLWRLVACVVPQDDQALIGGCLAPAHWPAGLAVTPPILMQQQLLEVLPCSAQMREFFWGWLGKHTDPAGLSSLEQLKAGLAKYARATSKGVRTVDGLFGDELTWQAFAAWWPCFSRTGAVDVWTRKITEYHGHAAFDCVTSGALESRLSLDTQGYN